MPLCKVVNKVASSNWSSILIVGSHWSIVDIRSSKKWTTMVYNTLLNQILIIELNIWQLNMLLLIYSLDVIMFDDQQKKRNYFPINDA